MKNPPWLDVAFAELGVKEVAGPEANPRIVLYDSFTSLKATSDEVPWCSAFACFCLEKSELTSPKSAAARDWLDWGTAIDKPQRGCIVILKRGSDPTKGHVTFWLEEHANDTFLGFGGNQHDMVCSSVFKNSDVVGYRMPQGWT